MPNAAATYDSEQLAKLNEKAKFLILLFSTMLILLACYSGIQHDYKAYVRQWASLVSGGDPYAEGNFYGPLHNAFGYATFLHPMAPKLIIAVSLVLANYKIATSLIASRPLSYVLLIYLFCIPLNGLFLGIGFVFGLNDGFVAALMALAVFLRIQERYIATAIIVALAALLKFYPILLLPFFFIEERKIRFSPILIGSMVFVLGLAASYFIWGPGLIESIIFGAKRGPKLLSILRDWRVFYGEGETLSTLIKFNSVLVVGTVATTFAYSYFSRMHWLEASILAYFNMLVVYKVGHQQFYLPLLMMLACLPLIHRKSADRMLVIFAPLIIFISVYHIVFDVGHIFLGHQARWIYVGGAGFMMFGLAILTNASLIFDRWNQNRRAHRNPNLIASSKA